MINKKYLKTKPICKVTFEVPKEATNGAKRIHLVGEFNDWDYRKTPLKPLKNGSFKVTLDLETGKEYQFRYLYDGENWENDWSADKYTPSGVNGEDNSVVIV